MFNLKEILTFSSYVREFFPDEKPTSLSTNYMLNSSGLREYCHRKLFFSKKAAVGKKHKLYRQEEEIVNTSHDYKSD